MQYVSLSKIPNKYPDLKNYTKFKDDVVLLKGLYPEKNTINFQLPKYEDITPIDNTSFRFVIAVAADENDKFPKYFTSKTFYSDIKLAYNVGNPFFPIQALIGGNNVMSIYLKQYFEIFDKIETDEKDTPVDVVKNIFISDVVGPDNNLEIEKKKKEIVELETKLNAVSEKITLSETKLSSNLIKRSIFKKRSDIEEQKKDTEKELEDAKQEAVSLNVVINKLNEDIKGLKESNQKSLLGNESVIDYEALIRFVDFMVTPAPFTLEGLETNNVLAAEKIGDWRGEWITAYKKRAAGDIIQATTVDDRIQPPKSQEGEKTFLQKVGELPVIKQVVGVVKAIGNFFGKLFSDSRLKEDVIKIGEIGGINIYKFKYKYDKSKTNIGVIAQELLNTEYANAVSVDSKTGFYVVDYNILQQKVDIVGAIEKAKNDYNKGIVGKSLFGRVSVTAKPEYQNDLPTKKLMTGGKLNKLNNNIKRDVGNTIFKKIKK
jgi:hypothetical protein